MSLGQIFWSMDHRGHVEVFIFADRGVVGAAPVVADHAEHVFTIRGKAGKRPQRFGHLGGRCVRFTCEDGGDRRAYRAGLRGIVGDAHAHQHRAEVGIAKAERAKTVAEPGDLLARELRHEHGDFEHDGPEPHRVLEFRDVEGVSFGGESKKIQGR